MFKQPFKNTQFSLSKSVQLGLIILIFLTNFSGINSEETEKEESWAEKTLASMTLKEKIGQLFMVAAFSNKGEKHKEEIKKLVKEQSIGGLIFFQGGPLRQAKLNNEYQKLAKIPLFIAMDAEWGLAMRLDSTVKYPRQMTLGAIQDKSLIYEMGKQIAIQSRRLGMQINFAPVVDVNVNPLNPVIGTRSFGENKYEVAERAAFYMRGMQDQLVLANAKHFPGHGDTDTDSHLDLPVINHDMERLNETELYPFQELFKEDLKSVMVAHIHIPAIDPTKNRATTLSQQAVTKLLKEQMGFEGLAFTDALNMKGVAKYHKPGVTDLLALKAGNDVLLYPLDVPKAIEVISKEILNGGISEEELNQHVLKILKEKEWSKISETQFVKEEGLYEDLNLESYEALNYKLRTQALTLLKTNGLLPLSLDRKKKILSITVGNEVESFNSLLGEYARLDIEVVKANELSASYLQKLKEKTSRYDVVILSLNHLNNQTRRQFGVTASTKSLVKQVAALGNVITCHYGNAYSLKDFETCSNLICAYQKHPYAEQGMAQVIVGAIDVNGRLPVSSGSFKQGDGISLSGAGILGFDFPSNAGLDAQVLEKIDSIVAVAMKSKAIPGCQVLIAKRGKVVYDKGFGYTDYKKKRKVGHGTVYDLASVTKVLASGMALMKLNEESKVDLNKTLGYYLPELKGTNKYDLIIKEVVAHQAGLKAFIPYWTKTLDNRKRPSANYYSKQKTNRFSLEVAENMYALNSLPDSILKWSNQTDLIDKEDGEYPYLYSDVGYYYIKRIIERISGQPLNDYLLTQVYEHMSLPTMGYQPLKRMKKEVIAPTEKDNYFRKKLIHGYVHDQGAAMMGGVAGHAGLFSNSFDVAQVLQMTLNNGEYNGHKFFNKQTIDLYTSKQLLGKNRKGATWDRVRAEGKGPSSDYVSTKSYGHSGFTGTLVWVDPDYDLVYVFLSNRVHPDASNSILLKTDVRTKIQDIIYESMLNFNSENKFY